MGLMTQGVGWGWEGVESEDTGWGGSGRVRPSQKGYSGRCQTPCDECQKEKKKDESPPGNQTVREMPLTGARRVRLTPVLCEKS